MTDPLERVIRPIVEGQVRGFLKEHPSIAKAVDWYAPRSDGATTLVNSLSKRILRDLLCADTRVRLVAALGGRSSAAPSTPSVAVPTAEGNGPAGTYAGRAEPIER